MVRSEESRKKTSDAAKRRLASGLGWGRGAKKKEVVPPVEAAPVVERAPV